MYYGEEPGRLHSFLLLDGRLTEYWQGDWMDIE